MTSASPHLPEPALIDVRSREDFLAGHVKGSINFPARELILRSGELPPRSRPLTVFVNESDSQAIELVKAFFLRATWRISDFVPISIGCEHSKEVFIDRGWKLEKGTPPFGLRFWEPSPFVLQMAQLHLPTSGIALDFGCGSGRDMAFLSGIGWSCVGIDNRAKLLQQAMAMSDRFGTQANGTVAGVRAHLSLNSPFRNQCADLVLMVRFLHRPSAPSMLACVAIGGFFLCSHFIDGVQHSAVGTPKSPDAYLGRGELLKWIAADGGSFTILHNEETELDDGRPIVNFLARRTA